MKEAKMILFSFLINACVFTGIQAEDQKNAMDLPPSIEQIIESMDQTIHLLFEKTESFLIEYKRLPSEDILKSEHSGGDVSVNWEAAWKNKQYYIKRNFIPTEKQSNNNDVVVSHLPDRMILRNGYLSYWSELKNKCNYEKFENEIIIDFAYDWPYFDFLGYDIIKKIIEDNNGDYNKLLNEKKGQLGFDFLKSLPLPEVLNRYIDNYSISNEPMIIDGHLCWMLEWKDRDIIWVDPQINFSVRKRITYDENNKQIINTIYNKEYREVKPGLWLPFQQIVDCYVNASVEPRKNWGKIAKRQTFIVNKIEVDTVNDTLFNVPLPVGTLVVDGVRNMQYTVSHPDSDPFAGPIGQGIRANRFVMIRAIIIMIGSAMILFAVWMKFRKKGA